MAIIPSFLPFADSLNQTVNEFFGSDGIDVLRNVSWDKRHLWTVDFIGVEIPRPFNSFFPAQDITYTLANIETDTIPFGQTEILIPAKQKAKEVTITFYDDENKTILKFLKDWIDLDIFNNGEYVSGVDDNHNVVVKRLVDIGTNQVRPTRDIEIKLLDSYKKTVMSNKYAIFPTGELTFSGSHASEASTYTMSFFIISEEKQAVDESLSFTDIGRDLLGRFI